MLKSKSLLEYTNLFSPNDYEKEWSYNILKIPIIKKMKKLYCVICSKYKKFEKTKISYSLEKH